MYVVATGGGREVAVVAVVAVVGGVEAVDGEVRGPWGVIVVN